MTDRPRSSGVPIAVFRSLLDSSLEPTEMLRVFRDRDGLFGLLGAWHDGRSVIGFDPVRRLAIEDDPFAALSDAPSFADPRGGDASRFGGGWVGAFGYQLGARIESLPPSPHRPRPQADVTLAYYDHVLVRERDGWWFEALVDEHNQDRLADQRAAVERALQAETRPALPFACTDFVGTPDAAGHRAAVASTLRHLAAGDIFQANVCRRFDARFSGDPLDAFCSGVEVLAPSYGAFLRTPDGAIASLSPELFLRRTGDRVHTSPIKGTAPLDSELETLSRSAKDRAENIMIVDLMRNDLGRVSVPGTVQVEDIARAERRAGVWHLVSDVVATLAAGQDDGTLLRATFPPGSVTGAPKVRAMEVIHEVESTGRETYTGAIGYASPAAGLELSVAIRTFEFCGGQVWLGVGGGVVIDSTPEGERTETLVKARPLLAAIGGRLSSAEELVRPRAVPSHGHGATESSPTPAVQPSVDLAQGVFTTCLVVDGSAVDLDDHLDRLAASVRECYGAALPSDLVERVARQMQQLQGRHRLRITVCPTAEHSCDFTVVSSRLPPASKRPLRLVPVVVPGGLGPHKYGDRRRLGAVEPTPGAWSSACDALVLDSDGTVLETGRGNLFAVLDDGILTPALDGAILNGVTRRRAIQVLLSKGIPVVERRLTPADLASATEVFVTSSVDRVRSVTSVDDVGTWGSGPFATWLARRLSPESPPQMGPGHRRHRVVSNDLTLLLVDNYDSFVYNLDQYVRELGASTVVVRNDALDVDEARRAVETDALHGVVISPGPGSPLEAGLSTEVVRCLGRSVPILGVCLGHQCIAVAYGAKVEPTGLVVHGKPSLVHHDGLGVFSGLEGPLVAGRYHSLVVAEESLPLELVVTSRTGRGVVMGLRHRQHPVEGVQFHPESILSPSGQGLLATFMDGCQTWRDRGGGLGAAVSAASTP